MTRLATALAAISLVIAAGAPCAQADILAFGAHSRQVAKLVRRPGKYTVEVIAIRDEPAHHAAFYTSSILIQD